MQLHRSESTILVVALALVFQPSSANSNGGRNGLQQVFTNGPGRGYVAVQRLSRTRNSQQPAAKQCAFVTQPKSVNATTGSSVQFVATANSFCWNIMLYTRLPVNSSSEQVRGTNSLDDVEYGLRITYTIPNVSAAENRMRVYFTAFPKNGSEASLSDEALLLVQGVPGKVSNLAAEFVSLCKVHVTCDPPPTLANIPQWGTVYSELAPPTHTNTCNLILQINRSTTLNLNEPHNLLVGWTNCAGRGENTSVSLFLVGGFTLGSFKVSPVSCRRTKVCLTVTWSLALPVCPGCYPTKLRMFVEKTKGTMKPIGQPHKLLKKRKYAIKRRFRLQKQKRYDIVAIFSNPAYNITERASINAFDIQNVSVVKQNGKGCFTCVFLTNSPSMGCFINITEPNGRVFNITAMRNHAKAHTANVCTEGALPQNSTLQVYGIDQDGKISETPAYSGIFSVAVNNSTSTSGAVIAGSIVSAIIVVLICTVVITAIVLVIWKKRKHSAAARANNPTGDTSTTVLPK